MAAFHPKLPLNERLLPLLTYAQLAELMSVNARENPDNESCDGHNYEQSQSQSAAWMLDVDGPSE
jgi:hypothetical protein